MSTLPERRYDACCKALKEVFGFPAFRPFQDAIIKDLCVNKDVLAIASTGSGKSALFAVPSLVLPGTTLVVSPLKSLMSDQVNKLRGIGVNAAKLTGDLSEYEEREVLNNFSSYDIVYVSPERALGKDFIRAYVKADIPLIALDESHVAVTWGETFRPAYAQVANLVEDKPRAIRLACTATASEDTAAGIRKLFRLRSPAEHISSPWRDNIKWDCVRDRYEDALSELVREYQEQEGSQVVYATTRKAVEELSEYLCRDGLSAAPYHAGMPDELRILTQQRFMDHAVKCIVATSAFGMGVDASDIRLVANYHIPDSLFSLLQQSGRAGRDGKDSLAWVNVNKESLKTQRFFITMGNPAPHVYAKLWRYAGKNGDEGVRVDEDMLRRICGVPEALKGQVLSAMSYLSFHNGIDVKPGGTMYAFDIRNKFIAPKAAATFRARIKADGKMYYSVGPDQEDKSKAIVKSGAVWPTLGKPIYKLRALSSSNPITQDMLVEKRVRADDALEQLQEFCWSDNKKAFVENAFVKG